MTPLVVCSPTRPFWVDATAMGVTPAALDALPFERAFDEMEALEAGAIANPDEGRQVGHYWLRAPERAPDLEIARGIGAGVEQVTTFARQVRDGAIAAEDGHRFTDLVHIGIGGSALGPQLLADALDEGAGLPPTFLDNTDPDGIARQLARLGDRLRHSLVVTASKSGGTPETANGLELVRRALRRAGLAEAPRLVAITQDGSALHQRAVEERWLATFPMWDWVGGRTSLLSAVGLLPAELFGVDTASMLVGAAEMDAWTRRRSWRENPAALLAGCWHVVGRGRGERAMVVLPYADRLVLLSRYLQQLVMESLGKELDRQGRPVFQGIAVYGNKGSTDQHAYVQQLRDGRDDFFATFVSVLSDGAGDGGELHPDANAGDFLLGFLLGTRRALLDRGRPSMTVACPKIDAFELGALVALFERAVGLYASLVDVNAYHQPGVEAGKKAAKVMLALSAAVRRELGAEPATAAAIAGKLGADRVEVFHTLERLAGTGRARRVGFGPEATYHRG